MINEARGAVRCYAIPAADTDLTTQITHSKELVATTNRHTRLPVILRCIKRVWKFEARRLKLSETGGRSRKSFTRRRLCSSDVASFQTEGGLSSQAAGEVSDRWLRRVSLRNCLKDHRDPLSPTVLITLTFFVGETNSFSSGIIPIHIGWGLAAIGDHGFISNKKVRRETLNRTEPDQQ